MKRLVGEVLAELNVDDPLLGVAQELERVALEDEYFTQRKLYPNVDYYSGIMLRAIGIPTSMFTVLFAMSRTVGWVSHWYEMIAEGQLRIGRPRQLYAGPPARHFTSMAETAEASDDTKVELKRSLSSAFWEPGPGDFTKEQ